MGFARKIVGVAVAGKDADVSMRRIQLRQHAARADAAGTHVVLNDLGSGTSHISPERKDSAALDRSLDQTLILADR